MEKGRKTIPIQIDNARGLVRFMAPRGWSLCHDGCGHSLRRHETEELGIRETL
jgi:hypothetical protein